MEVPEYYDALGEKAHPETLDSIYSTVASPGYGEVRGREPFGVSVVFTELDGDLEGVTVWLQRATRQTRGGFQSGCFDARGEDIAYMGHRVSGGPIRITQRVAERVAGYLESKRLEAEDIGRTAVRDFISSTNSINDPQVW